MAEKIKHQKNTNQIKNDLLDIKIRYFNVDDATPQESRDITKAFGAIPGNNKL